MPLCNSRARRIHPLPEMVLPNPWFCQNCAYVTPSTENMYLPVHHVMCFTLTRPSLPIVFCPRPTSFLTTAKWLLAPGLKDSIYDKPTGSSGDEQLELWISIVGGLLAIFIAMWHGCKKCTGNRNWAAMAWIQKYRGGDSVSVS